MKKRLLESLLHFSIILLGFSCGEKKERKLSDISKPICDCFSNSKERDIDFRLRPCMERLFTDKENEMSGFDKLDSSLAEKAKRSFSNEILVDMVYSCNPFFMEISRIYDNSYLLDSSQRIKNTIQELDKKLESLASPDSIPYFLNLKISYQIKRRDFISAKESIDSFKIMKIKSAEIHLASAYILNQTGHYKAALAEINKAIELSGNPQLTLFAALTKRRAIEKTK